MESIESLSLPKVTQEVVELLSHFLLLALCLTDLVVKMCISKDSHHAYFGLHIPLFMQSDKHLGYLLYGEHCAATVELSVRTLVH